MAKIKSDPRNDSYTAVHWLQPANPVWVCLGTVAGVKCGESVKFGHVHEQRCYAQVPCGARSDDDADPVMPPDYSNPDAIFTGYCANGCEAGFQRLATTKVIVEVGADRTLLNLILPSGVTFTVWGNGDAAIFTDPDDELGEHPDIRIEGGKVLPGGYDISTRKAVQHQ